VCVLGEEGMQRRRKIGPRGNSSFPFSTTKLIGFALEAQCAAVCACYIHFRKLVRGINCIIFIESIQVSPCPPGRPPGRHDNDDNVVVSVVMMAWQTYRNLGGVLQNLVTP